MDLNDRAPIFLCDRRGRLQGDDRIMAGVVEQGERMMEHEIEERRAYLRHVMAQEIPIGLTPVERLCLAILRQAVADYFGDDLRQREDAAQYFAHSPLYQSTLRLFGLPPDMLPEGMQLIFSDTGEVVMPEKASLALETLVRQLSGTQLKVVMTMGLLSGPASAGRISRRCELHRGTVMAALSQLMEEGLVESLEEKNYIVWRLPDEVRHLLSDMWGSAADDAASGA